MPDVSLIIPFLNEEENLTELITQLNEYAKKQTFSIEAVMVDDGSTDKSVQVLRGLISETVSVKLVRLSKNFGTHAALRAGLTEASGEYTMLFMADMQEPFSVIGEMYLKACEGYDIVAARRVSSKVSFSERGFSGIFTSLVRKFAIRDYPKGGANNFLFNSKVKEHLKENPESNSPLYMQIFNIGFKKAIIEVTSDKRHKGKSKWTLSKKIKLFIDSFVSFSYMPIRAISILGLLMFISGALYSLFIIIVKLTGLYEYDAGFPTFISILLVGFGLTNFSLSVIAEYLWRTFDAARKRPVYIIDTVESISVSANEKTSQNT